jgi:hypothetical protein
VFLSAYPAAVMSNAGTNTVTGALSGDDNNNNAASLDMVSATTFNYRLTGCYYQRHQLQRSGQRYPGFAFTTGYPW